MLLVEDNPDAAETLSELLSLWGHEVQIARTGGEGLEHAAAHRPDVVILDIGLPDIDGYAVARRLRKLPGLQSVRIIALTGYGQAEDQRRSRGAGFDAHLVKQADLKELQRLLAAPSAA